MDPLDSISTELDRAFQRAPTREARLLRTIDDYDLVVTLSAGLVTARVSDRRDRIPRTVSLEKRRGRTSTGALSLSLGAAAFDRALELSAPEAWAMAVFRESTRSLVLLMIGRWGAVVEAGTISIARSGPDADREVLSTMRAAFDLVRALSVVPEQIPSQLMQNLAEDPEPGFRERVLRVLAAQYPDLAPDACRRALSDPEPVVRLVAAISLETDAAVENALADLATSWGIAPEVRIEAFERFLEVAADVMPVLERALADPILAERAVYATSRFADPSWTDLLADVFRDCDVRLQIAIALVLADVGHADAETLLLQVPTVPAVIDRLAEIGTARAIPLLKQFSSKEARAAVARIKERVGDATGRVGLVDAEDRGGALSESAMGRLSLDEE